MVQTTASVVCSQKRLPKTPKKEKIIFPRAMELLTTISLVENKTLNFQNTALPLNHVESTEHEYSKQHKPRKSRDKKTDRAEGSQQEAWRENRFVLGALGKALQKKKPLPWESGNRCYNSKRGNFLSNSNLKNQACDHPAFKGSPDAAQHLQVCLPPRDPGDSHPLPLGPVQETSPASLSTLHPHC